MMPQSELSEYNFKRISLINWVLAMPLTLIFGWPYYFFSGFLKLPPFFAYVGAFFFALPFLFTILHGHVTMALGAVHRHHYYDWLMGHPTSFGLLFHTSFTKTRFRLVILGVSIAIMGTGYLLNG